MNHTAWSIRLGVGEENRESPPPTHNQSLISKLRDTGSWLNIYTYPCTTGCPAYVAEVVESRSLQLRKIKILPVRRREEVGIGLQLRVLLLDHGEVVRVGLAMRRLDDVKAARELDLVWKPAAAG